jgi:hypothetical protein
MRLWEATSPRKPLTTDPMSRKGRASRTMAAKTTEKVPTKGLLPKWRSGAIAKRRKANSTSVRLGRPCRLLGDMF